MISMQESQDKSACPSSPGIPDTDKSSPLNQSVEVQNKVLLMSSKKNLDNAPAGAESELP